MFSGSGKNTNTIFPRKHIKLFKKKNANGACRATKLNQDNVEAFLYGKTHHLLLTDYKDQVKEPDGFGELKNHALDIVVCTASLKGLDLPWW